MLTQKGFTEDPRIFQLAMDALPEPLLVVNREFVITWMNQAARQMVTGGDRPQNTLLCYSCHHRKSHPCHVDGEICALKKISSSLSPLTTVHQHFSCTNELRDVEIISAPLLSSDGTFEGIVQSMRDITERKRLESKLQTWANTDGLTGLYNRRGFFAIAEKQLKAAKRLKTEILLLSADLDGLKAINDKYGHHAGDCALIEFSSVLKECFRESDVIARIGGDEFVVFQIEHIEKDTDMLATRLQDKLGLRSQASGQDRLSTSIGIAHADPGAISSIDELLAKADKLMYEKKQRKRTTRTR
jgi:diguanylate cyclase (GGDEF)-like protein